MSRLAGVVTLAGVPLTARRIPFMAFFLVESTIFAVSESGFGAGGAETSMEAGAGSISGMAMEA